MRKHLILLAAVALMATAATAQTPSLKVGASLQYAHDFHQSKPNIGADLRAVVDLCEIVGFRAIANINGFVPDGFDRYGAAMMGVTVGHKMAYCFADFGFSLNPSSRQRINPDIDTGIGIRYDIADLHRLFAEVGTDFTPTGRNDWHTNLFAKIGYTLKILQP